MDIHGKVKQAGITGSEKMSNQKKKIHRVIAEEDYRQVLEILDKSINKIIRNINNVDKTRQEVGEMKKILSAIMRDYGYRYGVKDK